MVLTKFRFSQIIEVAEITDVDFFTCRENWSFSTLNEMVFCEILGTVFPHVVAAATILVWNWSAASIQGRKLFKGGNYWFLSVNHMYMI